MLGHLKPRFCRLSSTSKQHYQHLYCSLCYSLGQQFGLTSSFFINHELTLSLAAFPVYAEMERQECACPAKLFCQQKPILRDPAIDKAAQLCLLLVWLKLIDWETDKPAFYKRHFRLLIEAKVQPVLENLNLTTRQFIDSYLLLIRANSTDFNTSVKMSGLLAQHIFQELNQNIAPVQKNVSEITLLLGELITLADALLDLKQDIQQQQYNPIIRASLQNNTRIKEEFALLHKAYDNLVQQIKNLINSTSLKNENPLFCEILQQSLHNLNHKIQAANPSFFAAPNPNRRNNFFSRWCDGCDGCCDCIDCCQCCADSDSCCCAAKEKAGGCCECSGCCEGGCCDCGACDCAGCDCSC